MSFSKSRFTLLRPIPPLPPYSPLPDNPPSYSPTQTGHNSKYFERTVVKYGCTINKGACLKIVLSIAASPLPPLTSPTFIDSCSWGPPSRPMSPQVALLECFIVIYVFLVIIILFVLLVLLVFNVLLVFLALFALFPPS